MPYVYRCRQCQAASPPGTRRDAEAYRREHRAFEHGGLVPDGEAIGRVPGSTPDPDARYVHTGAVLAALALLVAASIVARVIGH